MKNRFQVLDGWRGISILLVLAGHLLPLGPKYWQMNAAVAATGMAIFFILSGFLITTILLRNQNIGTFLIRRFMRIIPLAWPILLAALIFTSSETSFYPPHLLFYANWKPVSLVPATSHFWSLCVEMRFYAMIALLVLLLKSRAFVTLPPLLPERHCLQILPLCRYFIFHTVPDRRNPCWLCVGTDLQQTGLDPECY